MTSLTTVAAGTGAIPDINDNFIATSPAGMYGRRAAATSGLTWGYYGGIAFGANVANGTVALTASNTNYVVALRSTGVVSVATTTTNWNNTAAYCRLYQVVTGTASVTGYTDYRDFLSGADTSSLSTGLSTATSSISSLSTSASTALSTTASSIASLSTSTSSGLSTSASGIASLSTGLSSAISGIGSLSTSISSTNSGVASLSTSMSSGLSTATSGISSLSTGLSTTNSSIDSLSTSTSSGLSTATSSIASLSTSTSTAFSTVSSNVAALDGQNVKITGVQTITGAKSFAPPLAASSGTPVGLTVSPSVAVSGTAGFIGLHVNPSQTSVGSGALMIQQWGYGGTSAWGSFRTNGNFQVRGAISAGSPDGVTGGTSSLNTSGSFSSGTASVSADTTLGITHSLVLVDASAAARIITLPAAGSCAGRIYIIKKIDSSANTVTIDGNLSELIDGVVTQALLAQWQAITIQSNGTSWFITAKV